MYRRVLHKRPSNSSFRRGRPRPDSFYVSIPNVATEFSEDIMGEMDLTLNGQLADMRKARSVNFLDQVELDEPDAECTRANSRSSFSRPSFSRLPQMWSLSADNLDQSTTYIEPTDIEPDSDVFMNDQDLREKPIEQSDGFETSNPPSPPPRSESLDSDSRSKHNSGNSDISKSHSDHSCLRVSESSIHAEREGLPSKSLEMVMLEADTITPPPKFRAPNVSQLSSLSYDSPKPKSVPSEEGERKAKLDQLLAKFSKKPKRAPLSNASSLCNSTESLEDIPSKISKIAGHTRIFWRQIFRKTKPYRPRPAVPSKLA